MHVVSIDDFDEVQDRFAFDLAKFHTLFFPPLESQERSNH